MIQTNCTIFKPRIVAKNEGSGPVKVKLEDIADFEAKKIAKKLTRENYCQRVKLSPGSVEISLTAMARSSSMCEVFALTLRFNSAYHASSLQIMHLFSSVSR